MKVMMFESWTVSPCTGSTGPYTRHEDALEDLEDGVNNLLANPAIKLVSTQYHVRVVGRETAYSCMVTYDDAPALQPKRTTKKK